jgi:hypothetical protein
MSLMLSFNYVLYNKCCVRLKTCTHKISSKSRIGVHNDEFSRIKLDLNPSASHVVSVPRILCVFLFYKGCIFLIKGSDNDLSLSLYYTWVLDLVNIFYQNIIQCFAKRFCFHLQVRCGE